MNDLSAAIVPKSDQTNADDLISGPRTIRITKVTVAAGEQPVSVHYEGDQGKPYKPCKSMCRVLVMQWGPNGDKYVGRELTLYRDAKVTWGGMAVGGIRISHMSDIPGDVKMAITESRKTRSLITVHKLESKAAQPTKAEKPAGSLEAAMTWIDRNKGMGDEELKAELGKYSWSKEDRAAIKQALDARAAKPATREPGQEG